ncbi:hypothetical protein EN786_01000 [Mesorhizobium sp. M4B.F.Ca.ET.143.01.1.1]|nr:hypothetical protein EOA31_19380 [Mesorhizobium sp. M4B.F.Ca.ET.049.02.1.2]TGV28334.1 hypothetical protein EN786_01000 [Mesorhizobium sp. M4B.F.Ca.ET.143.01.1.1]
MLPLRTVLRGRAAPHLAAAIFSPWNGEKDAGAADFANRRQYGKRARVVAILLLPVLRGEGAGRRMRGGAGLSI